MAAISVTSTTTSSITVNVTGLSTTAKHIEFYIDNDLDKYYALSGTSRSHTYKSLDSGTTYTLSAVVYDSSWNVLTFKNNSVSGTTKAAAKVTVTYYDGKSSDTDSGTSIEIYGSLTNPSGWTFEGWATSTSSTTVSYEEGEIVSAGSSNKTLKLYAVYSKSTKISCYYIDGSTGELSVNTRTGIQYRYNTSTTTYATAKYNTVTLPSFGTANQTISTSTPGRDWSVLGWRGDTTAAAATYSGGASVSSVNLSSKMYAVYSNTCSITYDANGGSGSMSKQSATAYYNAYGNYTTPSFSISSCTFTGPSGKSFSHWNQYADGSGKTYSGSLSTNYNIILYAIWAALTVTINYYDGNLSSTSTGDSSLTVGGGLRSDWTFVGWSTTTSSTSVSYAKGATISATTSNKTVNLYAIYKDETTIVCYYRTGDTGVLSNNNRTKIQYRCNTSTTTSSTNFYNTITLPSFDSTNSTVTTSEPNRQWTAIGWREDTKAASAEYSVGQSISSDLVDGNLYAVYSNTCSITYNANGGSGSMGVDSATAYYNAYGNYTTPSFNVDVCTFTPPANKKFSHWNAKADDSGTFYLESQTVSTNYNVIFYAIWIKGRPSNWQWTSTVSAGAAMPYTKSGTTVKCKPLTAKEWNAFIDRIFEFLVYKDQLESGSASSLYVTQGTTITAKQMDDVCAIISLMEPPTALPTRGTRITAAFINGLKNSLNSIE